MTIDRSELMSMTGELQELADRAARAGDAMHHAPTEEVALALYEAERGMRAALRAMQRALRTMP